MVLIFFFSRFIYFRERDREHEHEVEREKESQADSVLSEEPDAGLDLNLTTLRLWPEPKSDTPVIQTLVKSELLPFANAKHKICPM